MARLCKRRGNKDDIQLTTLDANPRIDFSDRPGKVGHVAVSSVVGLRRWKTVSSAAFYKPESTEVMGTGVDTRDDG